MKDMHFIRNFILGMLIASLAYLGCFMLLAPFFSASCDLFYDMYTACFFGSCGLVVVFLLYERFIDKMEDII